MRSALTNLVNNAIKYTPPGKLIRVEWQRLGGRACFAVTDEGEGIAPEHLGKLTERFYRVDKSHSKASGGTGLGLYWVAQVACLMRATVRYVPDSQHIVFELCLNR